MAKIEILDSGLIYQNPKPFLISRQAFFPSIVELPDGELVAAMDIGSAFEAIDVRSYICRSNDGGKTWSEPRQIFEPDESNGPISTTCRISRMPGDELAGIACLFDRSQEDMGLGNPDNEGFVRTDLAVIRSGDGGKTWGKLEPIIPPLDWDHFETCSPIVPLTETQWMLPTSLWRNWSGQCPHGMKAVAFLSEDAGKTWPRVVDVFDAWAEGITSWESKHIRLSDGKILAVCWAYDTKQAQSLPNRYSLSSGNAASFGPAREAPIHGETCTPVALDGNHVLFIYRRVDKKGLWAHLAKIEGDRWQPLADVPLWGSRVTMRDTSTRSALGSMSTLRFGYPSVIRQANGNVLLAFWCVEDCLYSIRMFRLAVR